MKIALIGYGKMGHMIEEIALQRGHEIVARIDVNDAFDLNGADVAIEFTTPQTAKENILRAWAQGVPVVSGTTGWKAEELRDESLELREVESKKLIVDSKTGKTMLVWSSNFSVGVNIFFGLNKYLAEAISKQQSAISYTPSITEIHHIHKLDKPSGTAKTLCEQIQNLKIRKFEDLKIESIREGEVPGTHEVKWDSEEDTIIITHIAKGRRGFALGAILAAEDILKEKNIFCIGQK
ncbi:MAG: 4-hydroxy-tetrahydrodipicolinate reductase [Paludibacteraceae bacterium]|nr:4-hydroxy-tetrahydrodipicolinate reductase [Paludibacteraceae bacterium]